MAVRAVQVATSLLQIRRLFHWAPPPKIGPRARGTAGRYWLNRLAARAGTTMGLLAIATGSPLITAHPSACTGMPFQATRSKCSRFAAWLKAGAAAQPTTTTLTLAAMGAVVA